MVEEIKHYQVNGKYRIVYERIGSAKGTIGVKVEANGDDIVNVQQEAVDIFRDAVTNADKMSVKEG